MKHEYPFQAQIHLKMCILNVIPKPSPLTNYKLISVIDLNSFLTSFI